MKKLFDSDDEEEIFKKPPPRNKDFAPPTIQNTSTEEEKVLKGKNGFKFANSKKRPLEPEPSPIHVEKV